jgi:5-methylcytosine-specific restriction protein B
MRAALMTDQSKPPTGIPNGITTDDVLGALADFDAGSVDHRFRDSTGYDLLYQGRRYPPKAVIGLAARRIRGRVLDPNEFSGGEDSRCFAVLRTLGFQIVPKELPPPPEGAGIWFENTKSAHEHGGPGWEFGTCLWSPSRDRGGKDWYNAMREVRKGDLIVHSCDGEFRGVSYAKGAYQERQDEPPKPAEWAGMAPYYRIDLEGFLLLETPLPLKDLFDLHGAEIKQEIESIRSQADRDDYLRPPFEVTESDRIKRGQTYLTHCTAGLYRIIRDWAQERSPARTKPVPDGLGTRPLDNLPRFWAISLGEGGRLWNKCQEDGVAAIGWDELGDLRQYSDREAIARAMRSRRASGDPAPHNDSLACYEFAYTMRPGDYVVAKIGRSKLLGVGVVRGDYRYDAERPEYHHVRDVEWLRAANLELPENAWVPTKTLTDATDHQPFVEFVRENLIERPDGPEKIVEVRGFTIDDALADVFLPRGEFEAILSALRRKKNVLLQGAPGVGKTFFARRLAYALLGQRDPSRLAMVQFHQSYAYEDFVQGYRPNKSGGFQRRDGLFYDFCNRARTDLGRPYVFIIDEINRGNLSKIFGELMMLIEADKRGSEYAIPLTYADVQDPLFSVPENVHLLGLMNTADRSLAMVDYALRRRFVFFTLAPQFDSPAFHAHLSGHGAPIELVNRIITRMTELNGDIRADDKNLGEGFVVGHSFFCLAAPPPDWSAWYADVIRHEISPLLCEYWFDAPEQAQQWTDRLLAP